MLSMHDVQLLWEVMSRCDDTNSAKIARIIRDDLNGNYINKKKPAKRVNVIPEGHEWLRNQSWEVRQTAEDMGEWLAENETHNRYLEEFQNGNKIPLIKRFRTLSQAYCGTNATTGGPGACGLKEAKDAIETVFGRYVKQYG